MQGVPRNPNGQTWFNANASGAITLPSKILPSAPGTNANATTFKVTGFKSNTRLEDVLDGTSNTFLAGEKHVPEKMFGRLKVGDGPIFSGAWTCYAGRIAGPEDPLATGPSDITPSAGIVDGIYARKFGSYHPGICQFVFCDGSVRQIRTSISASTTLRWLSGRKDGMTLSLD